MCLLRASRLRGVRFGLLTIISLGCALTGRASTDTADEPPKIGVARRVLGDPARKNWANSGPRVFRVTLWYPSRGDGVPERFEDDGSSALLLRDGGVADAERLHPLILISHGSGGSAAQMFWLGHFLAEHGYIVAAVDHNGSDEEELHYRRPTLTDFFAWERASDLSVALDRLLADRVFGERIDAARIGAAGFSLGGTTALWTAGARIDLESLRLNSPPPPPSIAEAIQQRIEFSMTNPVGRESVARAPLSYRDARVRAVFALAPPMGAGFTAEGLADVNVPVCIVVGDADPIAPAETNAQHFADHISTAHLIVVPGERGHFVRPISADQRRAELREVAEMALEFFGRRLR